MEEVYEAVFLFLGEVSADMHILVWRQFGQWSSLCIFICLCSWAGYAFAALLVGTWFLCHLIDETVSWDRLAFYLPRGQLVPMDSDYAEQ